MKLLVLFGSSSDAPVYEPLIESLNKNHSVKFFALSAHRNADQLRTCLNRESYDAVVAGAGLSAHLPGVVSSLTRKPVIGIPVKAHLGGMDSLLSILQMPGGVPVHTYASDKFSVLSEILKNIEKKHDDSRIQILASAEDSCFLEAKITKVTGYCKKLNLELIQNTSELKSGARGMELVNLVGGKDLPPQCSICVPVLSIDKLKKPESAMILSQLFEKPALFVGINNVLNGFIANLQWMNIPDKENILTQLKRGFL